ncbi:hypothetical protein NDA11_002968 [Ustilago hordei]|uniref:Uncharacterized protein n=1 Tax=Ustilago hordei TaxID=120017 RepID=I2FST6_USTHO|nr:hypothetical protein NDA10_006482 [Ustilago hordei]KAJ1570715.1 hypothetical protein NDA11_002968 [Ustilago hordei]KAJ1587609.1 hypothetical protein NDA15_007022 [Ustilago hordei]KAJ1590332.1 hypothetical protein NDA12_006254 [Ustilago hordei]UTT96622.1 hypothetical protein NDA17_003005 [Ustilago hordei]
MGLSHVAPLSGNQLHVPELGPPLGSAWSYYLHVKLRHTIILATDLHRICHTIITTTDPGGIRGTSFIHTYLSEICHRADSKADLSEICHRADSKADLSELCHKPHNLPDPLIPALPSYEPMDPPTSCASRPMTVSWLYNRTCRNW